MLMLVFSLGEDRYALKADQIVEIIPSVALRKLPHAPDFVAGLFDFRGDIVPVIDLGSLILGRPCRSRLSTRILLVSFPAGGHFARTIGLRAEHVTETIRISEKDLIPPGILVEEAPYLGEMIRDAHGMIQCIRVERLFTRSLVDLLFIETAGHQ